MRATLQQLAGAGMRQRYMKLKTNYNMKIGSASVEG